jgi:hypothetical protein
MDYLLDEQKVLWQDVLLVLHLQSSVVVQVVSPPPLQFVLAQPFLRELFSLLAQPQPVLNLETYPSTCAQPVLQQLMMLSEQIRQPLAA